MGFQNVGILDPIGAGERTYAGPVVRLSTGTLEDVISECRITGAVAKPDLSDFYLEVRA
jgi:hypothetical protein